MSNRQAGIKQASLFMFANLAAGFLHYLFQLVAARRLTPAGFAELNGWFADVAICLFLAGLLQYAANFWPAPRRQLRFGLLTIVFICLGCLGTWLYAPEFSFARGASVIVAAAAFGWLIGQAQIRLAFGVMSAGNLAFGVAKLAISLWPTTTNPVAPFAFALLAGYFPAILLLALALWRVSDVEKVPTPSWQAPLMLSLAGAVIPQFDMVLMNHTQPATTFQAFAQASLFYKGIYFALFILAQWLLPQQIHRPTRTPVPRLPATGACAVVVCAVIWVLAPLVSTLLLRWPSPPDGHLVFWSCLHMSVLTMLFFWVQETCALRRPRLALWALGALAVEAGFQLLAPLPAATYVVAIALVQTLVLIGVHALSRRVA